MAFVNQLGDWNGKALFDSAKPDPVEEALLAGMDHDDGSGHVYAFVNRLAMDQSRQGILSNRCTKPRLHRACRFVSNG